MKKNKAKIILPAVAVCVAIAVLFTYRMSLSYLIDNEVKDNTITLGNVSIKLDEGSEYKDSSIIAAGNSLPKAPVVTNTGISDEYVFIEIAVPKANVTLLYEQNTTVEVDGGNTVTRKEGTPATSNGEASKNLDEIFKTVADGHSPASPALVSEATAPNKIPQTEIWYNSGKSETNDKYQGWMYLGRGYKTVDNRQYNLYYFGYNRILKYDDDKTEESQLDKTVPLFDRIQLKSFIDEELVSSENNVKTDYKAYFDVKAYAVQADSLGVSELSDITRTSFLTDDQLKKIWGIVQRKAGGQ